MSAVKAGRKELSRLAGERAPKERRGSHAYGNNPERIHGQHKWVGKGKKKLLTCMTSLRPFGPPPYEVEVFSHLQNPKV